ncbi:MAG: ChbG/HpnK family deacetylase [Methylococcaceae bacterium]|nr:ChbG/HpnK family deacetylase [Methylococcaceae bacterium]
MDKKSIDLIINADDYGYFSCISRGIIAAARLGALSATGILANGAQLQEQLSWLEDCENLDLGIHLTLSYAKPLTSVMADKLEPWNGHFPGAFAIAGQILSGRIGLDEVRAEWRAQIEALLDRGLALRFINSHEHIHMLPMLFPLALELAEQYRIPHLRLTRAEWLPPFSLSASLRNALVQTMSVIAQRHRVVQAPLFLGLSRSGRLDLNYLEKRLATLQPRSTYELMCHPGYFDPAEITDPHLLAYHAWEKELALLTGSKIQEVFERFGVRLVHYGPNLSKL